MSATLPEAGLIMSDKTMREIEATDAMSPEMRAVVHAYGTALVNTFVCHHVTEPEMISHFIHSCWMGARQTGQRRARARVTGVPESGSPVATQLDWLLMQAGAEITAARLIQFLSECGMVIVPKHPSDTMIAASMAEVSGHTTLCTKTQKHTRRLRAAIDASTFSLWPQLRAGKS